MAGSLENVKILSFFPWRAQTPSGARTRLSSFWRYCIDNGAEITHAILEEGVDLSLKQLHLKYFGKTCFFHDPSRYNATVRVAASSPSCQGFSDTEMLFLLMHMPNMYLMDAGLEVWLTQLVERCDIVTVEYPMFVAVIAPICKRLGKPLLVTTYDVLADLHGKNPQAKALLLASEVKSLNMADAVFVVSDNDHNAFAAQSVRSEVVINAIDSLSVTPGNEVANLNLIRNAIGIKEQAYVLFVGSMHEPNAEAAQRLSLLARQYPELAFVVGGSCRVAERLGNFYSLGVLSNLSLDVLYRGALAVVVPLLRGGGTSLKLVEAMAYGKAVISTTVGVRGHTVENGKNVLISDTIEDFPKLALELLRAPAQRALLAENARAYALAHDFRLLFAPYGRTINRLLKRSERSDAGVDRRDRTLILVDGNLGDTVGHHLTYGAAIKDEATRRGLRFVAIGRKDATPEVKAQLNLQPALSRGVHDALAENPYPTDWEQLRTMYDFLGSNHAFLKELSPVLAQYGSAADVVFFPNASHRQLLALALWLQWNPFGIAPQFVLLFRYDLFVQFAEADNIPKRLPNTPLMDLYRLAFGKLEAVVNSSMLRLTTDSEELSREFQALTSLPVSTLPIPHTTPVVHGDGASIIPAKRPGVTRIVYLGDARAEKGFQHLPELVRELNRMPQAAAIEFVFQAYISSPYHEAQRSSIETLKQLGAPNLMLIERSLSVAEYQALLHSADLVLIIYDIFTYTSRTSGPFVEAICAGKPVVVPNRTWMSNQLGTSGAGMSYDGRTQQDINRACVDALRFLPQLTRGAVQLSERFRAYHNPANFVSLLMG